MAPSEALRPHADRIARLLADARGTEILNELQKLAIQLGDVATALPCPPSVPEDAAAVWRIEPTAEGVALRRDEDLGEWWYWADVPYVPPPGGARRVVLIGESVARGWIYDPDFNPAGALRRHLDKAGGYQIVDLARAGASVEDLTELAGRLPLLEPDVVVVFAGNNWTGLPLSPDLEVLDTLARTLRESGYAAARRAFIEFVMVPRAHSFLDRLVGLHADHGTKIIMVVPEFNLQGWVAPADIDVPALASDLLSRWYKLRDTAIRACQEQRWAEVAPVARQMTLLDGGTSPIPGALSARAAVELGDGPAARAGLEASRDALIGVGVLTTPRISREIQDLLTAFARENACPCIDLRTLLAADDPLGLPDPAAFVDYCHLSDAAIEQTMSAVADAILGLPAGTTPPGPGAGDSLRAVVRIHAAAHSAYLGQPAEVIRPHLRAAIESDPQVTTVLSALLDVLESTGPVWTHAAVETLAAMKSASGMFGPMLQSSNRPDGMWALRACLGEILDRTPPPGATEFDLLANADSTERQRPHCAPGRCYRQATAERSTLAFALHRASAAALHLTYRMPAAPPGTVGSVKFNDVPVGTFHSATHWTGAEISLPEHLARPGVNWLEIHWPVPVVDADERHATDAAALSRSDFPAVAPTFAELFDARLSLVDGASPTNGKAPTISEGVQP